MMDNKDQIRIARSVAIKLAFEMYPNVMDRDTQRWEYARKFTTFILTGAVPGDPVKEKEE